MCNISLINGYEVEMKSVFKNSYSLYTLSYKHVHVYNCIGGVFVKTHISVHTLYTHVYLSIHRKSLEEEALNC